MMINNLKDNKNQNNKNNRNNKNNSKSNIKNKNNSNNNMNNKNNNNSSNSTTNNNNNNNNKNSNNSSNNNKRYLYNYHKGLQYKNKIALIIKLIMLIVFSNGYIWNANINMAYAKSITPTNITSSIISVNADNLGSADGVESGDSIGSIGNAGNARSVGSAAMPISPPIVSSNTINHTTIPCNPPYYDSLYEPNYNNYEQDLIHNNDSISLQEETLDQSYMKFSQKSRNLIVSNIDQCTFGCSMVLSATNSQNYYLVGWSDTQNLLYLMLYNAAGTPVGTTLTVNSASEPAEFFTLASLSDNTFIVLWSTADITPLYGVILGTDNTYIEAMFTLNELTTSNIIDLQILTFPSQFVLVWKGLDTTTNYDYIYYKLFDNTSPDLQSPTLNTITSSENLNDFSIANSGSTQFTIAFVNDCYINTSTSPSTSQCLINVIIIDITSISTNPEGINTYTIDSGNTVDLTSIAFTQLSNGNYAMLWGISSESDTVYDLAIIDLTLESNIVNIETNYLTIQGYPLVTAFSVGDFAVGWMDSSSNINIQIFQNTGQSITSTIMVTSTAVALLLSTTSSTTSSSSPPALLSSTPEDFNMIYLQNQTLAIVWAISTDIEDQMYYINGAPVLAITCPSGTFLNITQPEISNCDTCLTNCETCIDSTSCISCITNNYLNYQTTPVSCVSTCPSETYPDSGICKNCMTNCQVCTNSTTCSTCNTGYSLLIENTIISCVDPCPSGMYDDLGTCQNCISNCQTCIDSLTCNICDTGYILLIQSSTYSCVTNCPTNMYNDLGICQNCIRNCQTCIDSLTCNTCDTGYILLIQNSTYSCVTNCPTNMYNDLGICQNCITECEICTNSTTCTQCNPGYYLLNQNNQDSCVNNCPSGTYLYENTLCEDCLTNCQVCMNSTTCITCNSGYSLLIQDTQYTCVNNCPSGMYDNQGICQNCMINCQICTDSTSCITCNTGYNLNNQNLCLMQCPTGMYLNQDNTNCITCTSNTYYSNGICNQCDSSCATCSGSSSNQCLTCTSSDQQLVQGTCQNIDSINTLTTKLKITSNPTIVYLQLQPRVQSLIDNINNSITLSINNNAYNSYTYNLSDTGGTDIKITFSYNSYLSPGATLKVHFTTDYIYDNAAKQAYSINPIDLSLTLLEYYPYSASELSTIQNAQQTASTTAAVSQVSTGAITIASSGSSNAYTVVQCIDLFSIVRYLNINFPPNAMSLFSQLKVQPISLTFLPNIFSLIPIEAQDLDISAPINFSIYNVQLFILNNFGGQLYQYLIMMSAAILFIFISILPLHLPLSISGILTKVQNFLVWNFILSFLMSNYFSGVMFIFIQFTNMQNNTPYQLTNSIINIFCIGYLMYPLMTFWITFKHYKALDNNEEQMPLPKYGSLLGDFKHDYLIQIMYPTIYLFRGFFAFGMLIWGMNFPLIIVIIWIVLCVSIILTLIIFKPYKKMKSNFLNAGCEVFNLTIYIIVLLIILTNVSDINTRNSLGFAILYLNTGLYIWITIFSIYDIIEILLDLLKQLRASQQEKAHMKYKPNDIELIEATLTNNTNQTFNISKRIPYKTEDDTIPTQEAQITTTDLSVIIMPMTRDEQDLENYISSADDSRLKMIMQNLKLKKFINDPDYLAISSVILRKSTGIKYLDLLLENESIEDSDMTILSTSILSCKKLTELKINLARNQLSNEGIGILFYNLIHLNKLKRLNIDLSYNHIGNKGIDIMADMLSSLDHLNELRINLNNSKGQFKSNIFDKLSKALEKQSQLEIIHLQFDSLNLGKEILPLMDSVSKLNLMILQISISNNDISSDDLTMIFENYLSKLTNLETFGMQLSKNPIESPAFKALGSLIKSCVSLEQLKLNLESTNITPEIMQILALDISQAQSITNIDLNLSRNNFCLMGIESLKNLTNLGNLSLNLDECGITNENIQKLGELVSNLAFLEYANIILTNNNIDNNNRRLLDEIMTRKSPTGNSISVIF